MNTGDQGPGGDIGACSGPDSDGDGVPDACDICALGSDNLDDDQDTVPNACDRCVGFSDLVDQDNDGIADGCDDCVEPAGAPDADGDGVPDACDVCVGDDRLDTDGDGVPNACDTCAGGGPDGDSDGVPDACDVCPTGSDTFDLDGDGVPFACDVCSGEDDNLDADADGVPDGCDVCALGDDTPDADADGVPDACDLCSTGDDALDADADSVPDACDVCATADDRLDSDGDGIPNACDTCVGSPADADGDGVPDACDVCPTGSDSLDADGDGVPDACDICGLGSDRIDTDGDDVPDACDACPTFDDGADADSDGVPDGCDVCASGDDTLDADSDTVPDACDVCADEDDRVDDNSNGVPDACECFGLACSCDDASGAQAATYYLDSLTIPTMADATGGATVGFDIDGQDNGCGLPDFQGQVDNALIALNGALGALPGDIDLQDQIDAGLCVEGTNPPAMELLIRVTPGTGCAVVEIFSEDTTGTPLTSFVASYVGGELSGGAPAFPLTIPYRADDGSLADINLQISDLRFTATLGAAGLTNVLLGGSLPAMALEQTVMDVLPIINGGPCPGTSGCIEFSTIGSVIGNLYDVPNPTSGLCGDQGSLSVGFFATAGTNPISALCPPQ